MVAASAGSVGHCNTMGTALSMNSLAEALGMSLPGCAAIPGPHKERGWMAYETGCRIVGMVHENLRPSDIMTKPAFENAVVAAAALGASSNCPISMIAIARHMGVDHTLDDWQRLGEGIPLLADVQPAGRVLGEGFFRAGGVPAVMRELLDAGKLHPDVMTCTGRTLGENLAKKPAVDHDVIRAYGNPLKESAGFAVLSGNLFDAAVMKLSVIDPEFRDRFLSDPAPAQRVRGPCRRVRGAGGLPRAHRGPRARRGRPFHPGDPQLRPGRLPRRRRGGEYAAPAALLKAGIHTLPTMGDGRQSGTSGSPSILNVSPEAAVGGGLALLHSGDRVRIDLNSRKVDVLLPPGELDARRAAWQRPELRHMTPWEEISRSMVGQHSTGACLEPATLYLNIIEERGESRNNH